MKIKIEGGDGRSWNITNLVKAAIPQLWLSSTKRIQRNPQAFTEKGWWKAQYPCPVCKFSGWGHQTGSKWGEGPSPHFYTKLSIAPCRETTRIQQDWQLGLKAQAAHREHLRQRWGSLCNNMENSQWAVDLNRASGEQQPQRTAIGTGEVSWETWSRQQMPTVMEPWVGSMGNQCMVVLKLSVP